MTQDLQLQDLLGMVAITTFLVGFSTVRVQASLSEWRGEGARILDRLLEQNSGDDLLPIPTTLQQLTGTRQLGLRLDGVTWLTAGITLISLASSTVIYRDQLFTSTDNRSAQQIQAVHLLIVALGVMDVARVRYVKVRELRRSAASRYDELRQAAIAWLHEGSSTNEKVLLQTCDGIDGLIPGWCWLTLIRFEVLDSTGKDTESLRQSVARVEHLASAMQAVDDYSKVAYVWSNYLLDPTKASQLITLSDIKHVCKFYERLANSGNVDIMAAMTLQRVQRSTMRLPDSELERILASLPAVDSPDQ